MCQQQAPTLNLGVLSLVYKPLKALLKDYSDTPWQVTPLYCAAS